MAASVMEKVEVSKIAKANGLIERVYARKRDFLGNGVRVVPTLEERMATKRRHCGVLTVARRNKVARIQKNHGVKMREARGFKAH